MEIKSENKKYDSVFSYLKSIIFHLFSATISPPVVNHLVVNAIGWHIVLLIFSVLKTAFSNKVQLYLFKIQVKFMHKSEGQGSMDTVVLVLKLLPPDSSRLMVQNQHQPH